MISFDAPSRQLSSHFVQIHEKQGVGSDKLARECCKPLHIRIVVRVGEGWPSMSAQAINFHYGLQNYTKRRWAALFPSSASVGDVPVRPRPA